MDLLALDAEICGEAGRYRSRIDEGWNVWGPYGGYVAALALRAIGQHSRCGRPASFTLQYVASAKLDWIDLFVETLRRGRSVEALRVTLTQEEKIIAVGSASVVPAALPGLEHRGAAMPDVPHHSHLRGYAEVADTFAAWAPMWHRAVEAKPCAWPRTADPANEPSSQVWVRLRRPCDLKDGFLQAARSALFLDLSFWDAVEAVHGWPPSYIAPNLDVSIHFHAAQFEEGAVDAAWLLSDGYSPIAAGGLVSSQARIWSERGELYASAHAHLLCRPTAR